MTTTPTLPPVDFAARLSGRAQRMTVSAIRELLKLTQRPDIISFAGGLPAPELFPLDDIRMAANAVLRDAETGAVIAEPRQPAATGRGTAG